MSAHSFPDVTKRPQVEREDDGVPRAKPLYFGPEGRPYAAWFHGSATPKPFGVVICNPFGHEAICAHRTLRHLADSLARASIPALRFDYDGTGDSAGNDSDPDRLAAWIESTRQACTALRRLSGVDRVWLVGLRFGAFVAALAAAGSEGVAGIVALAPVVVGKSYLRELRVLQTSLELPEPPAGVDASGDGGLETLGFSINAETRQSIGQINLATLGDKLGTDAPFDVLVLDRDDRPSGGAWIEHLQRQGVNAAHEQVSGYSDMMVDPHKSTVPLNMLRRVVDWLSERPLLSSPSPARALGSVDIREQAVFGNVAETPLFVDEDKRLFGVVTRGAKAPPSGRTIVLLNAGSIHHVGPNRLHVRLARTWAAQGHEVLRLDISGIGESSVREGQEENVVYSRYALEDIATAVDFVRRRGANDVRPVGLCSGAYFAMKSASTTGVAGFVAINPLTFDKPPPGPTDYPRVRAVRATARYRKAMGDFEKWKKLARGQVRLDAVAKTIGSHVAGRLVKYSREVARRLHISLRHDFGAELLRLAERNVEQRFVFASDDPGLELLHDEAEAVVKKLEADGLLRIDVVDRTDHTFTACWSHERLVDVLTDAITPR